jgi:GAF domain-containing protein
MATSFSLLAKPGQPGALFSWLDAEVKRLIGHRIFSLMVVAGDEVERVYTSQPEAYPAGGRKPMRQTPWSAHVMAGGKPWLGATLADIAEAFPDHALIASLGCGACINVPVIYDGKVIGTMNALDREGAYTSASVEMIAPLAPLAIPAFLLAMRSQ